MTVAELIVKLQAMPPEAIVKVYEFDADVWDDVAMVGTSSDDATVHIVGEYGATLP